MSISPALVGYRAAVTLLAPFAANVTLLLFAPAFDLAGILGGLSGRALVPVLAQPRATIDAYGAVKLLHGAGLSPVLAPLDSTDQAARVPLDQVVRTVTECAQRHLGLAVDHWPEATWAQRVPVSTLSRQVRPAGLVLSSRTNAFEAMGPGQQRPAQRLWS